MKKAILAGAAALVLMVGALTASAQIGTTNGTVVASTTTTVTVKTDDGVQKTYTVDKTSILPTAALRVGDRVTVDYNTLPAGDMIVSRVTVVPGVSATVTTAPPSATSTPVTTTSPSYSTTSTTTTTTSPTYSTTSTNDTYPDTASPEPLLLLVGGLGLAGAASLRMLRRS